MEPPARASKLRPPCVIHLNNDGLGLLDNAMSGDRRNPNNTQQWGPQSNGQYGQNGSYYAAQYDLQGV